MMWLSQGRQRRLSVVSQFAPMNATVARNRNEVRVMGWH
jgi:hypothetical protein